MKPLTPSSGNRRTGRRGPSPAVRCAVLGALACASCVSPSEPMDPLTIVTETLFDATSGVDYAADLAADGGDGSYRWELRAGSLPAGLHIDPVGAVTGTPAGRGATVFTVAVQSGDGQTATRELSLFVIGGPVLLHPAPGAVLDNGCSVDAADPITWDFDWADEPGARSYDLYVRGPTATVALVDVSGLSRSEFHFETAGGYVARHNLRGWTWKVRALVDGGYTPWSELRAFDVEPNNTDCA